MGANDVQGRFDHPLQSPSVLGLAHPKAICDASSQDAYYCSFVKIDKNLVEMCSLKKYTAIT